MTSSHIYFHNFPRVPAVFCGVPQNLRLPNASFSRKFGKDHKGLHTSGIYDQGDFCSKLPLNWGNLALSSQRAPRDILMPRVETRTAIYRSLRALRAQNPQKVSKKFPRASGPGVSKKCRKESKSLKKVSEKSLFETFLRLFDSFRHFLDTPGPEARGDFF